MDTKAFKILQLQLEYAFLVNPKTVCFVIWALPQNWLLIDRIISVVGPAECVLLKSGRVRELGPSINAYYLLFV